MIVEKILSVSTAMVWDTSLETVQSLPRGVMVTVEEETDPMIDMVGVLIKNALTVIKLVTSLEIVKHQELREGDLEALGEIEEGGQDLGAVEVVQEVTAETERGTVEVGTMIGELEGDPLVQEVLAQKVSLINHKKFTKNS